MRRKRGFQWHYFAFFFVVVGLAFGFYQLSKTTGHHQDEAQKVEVGENTSDESTEGRTVASEGGDDSGYLEEDRLSPKAFSTTAAKPKSPGGVCKVHEIPGQQGKNIQVDDKDWAKVVSLFYAAKGGLTKWLKNHWNDFGDERAKEMESRIHALKIEKPPFVQEPDLAWRGVPIMMASSEGKPVIRMGAGFIRSALARPERAKFEITRVAAQAWAPCELKKLGLDNPWQKLTGCLKVKDRNACENGSYSEAGWAVSTTVAAIVAPPGCEIPALKGDKAEECIRANNMFTAMKSAVDAQGSKTSDRAVSSVKAPAQGEGQ